MIEAVNQITMENFKNHISTYIYFEETQEALMYESSANYITTMFREVRKYGGMCTAFVLLLKQSGTETESLKEYIGMSDAQTRYVGNVGSGVGLVKVDEKIIPIDLRIGKEHEIYKLISTNVHE